MFSMNCVPTSIAFSIMLVAHSVTDSTIEFQVSLNHAGKPPNHSVIEFHTLVTASVTDVLIFSHVSLVQVFMFSQISDILSPSCCAFSLLVDHLLHSRTPRPIIIPIVAWLYSR